MKSTKLAAGAAAAFAVGSVLAASAAGAASITSYTATGLEASGFGGWTYTSNTLNDGDIPTTSNDNLLLYLPDGPSITFQLDGTYKLSEIDILSAYLDNDIPGNLISVTVTVGANSAVVSNVGYGALTDGGYPENEGLMLTGLLASTPTNSFTLSNFVSDGSLGYGDYTALGEVTVNAGAATPEPATWAMMLLGVGLAGVALRRGRKAVSAAA